MSKASYRIKASLVTQSPLHIGSGSWRKVSSVTGKQEAGGGGSASTPNETPDVASIQRDAEGKPYLPGTSLKALLRRIGESRFGYGEGGLPALEIRKLFGMIALKEKGAQSAGSADNKGSMGGLLFRGAPMTKAGDAGNLPYVTDEAAAADLGAGVFVSARTRIDAATGTAADGKLFFQEMVAPGASFDLELIIPFMDENRASDILNLAIQLLSDLTARGWCLGKSTADGFGEVTLDPKTVTITKTILTQNLELREQDASEAWRKRGQPQAVTHDWSADIHLRCDGPFMILDSSRTVKTQDQDNREPQLKAQRSKEDLPLVLGPSITGALRARGSWLQALDAHREAVDTQPDATEAETRTGDRILRPGESPKFLSRVERLFGVTGFRGLLAIEAIEVDKAQPWNVTSVKLDRFSGAPVDKALFTSATFTGTRLRFRLTLRSRPGCEISEADIALADRIRKDIEENGLMLGHGTNKGFGWFESERG